ncbi:hypothetical protein AB0M80_23450 [Amycolatopsis sp. NPDC051045]|uniref:hypothetical protein n=1 Tax=Amycolatopsis sp. NPDC051045 TaxID=3156922 RepID=UPI0034280684
MHCRKSVGDEIETTGQIVATAGRELPRRAGEAGSSFLASVIHLALTGDREAFIRIVSLFLLLVGAVVLVGAVLPWVSAVAVGGASAWAGRRARRGTGKASTRAQS